ncbi:uncharacterized protein V6R79_023872 [Siganus canaliculatus]
MTERRRKLPPWMAKKVEEVKEKQPLKRRRKPKPARSAFYCMNEKELVEAAVSYLSSAAADEDVALRIGQKVQDKTTGINDIIRTKETPAISKMVAKPVTEEVSSDSTDAEDMTYVSESDLDITEMETVPYVKNTHHQEPAGQRSRPGLDHVGQEVEEEEKQLEMPTDEAENDDALRLVREIFFT